MRFKLVVCSLVPAIFALSILATNVTKSIADDTQSRDCIYLYSNVPKWAIEQHGPKVIGLKVLSGTYKLSSGTKLFQCF